VGKKKEGERCWGTDVRDRAMREREGACGLSQARASFASGACWAAGGKVGRGERKRKGAVGGLLADFSFFSLSFFFSFFKLTQFYLNSNGI
jgi:hypothetical protein